MTLDDIGYPAFLQAYGAIFGGFLTAGYTKQQARQLTREELQDVLEMLEQGRIDPAVAGRIGATR